MKKRLLALLAGVLVFGAVAGMTGCSKPAETKPAAETPAAPAEEPAAASARADYFVTVADFDPAAVVVLDTRDPEAYKAGHVEGAISAPWQTFASVGKGKPGDDNWGTLLTPAEIGAALGKLGVDASKPIVTYSDPTGWGEDGRVMWTLLSAGIKDVKMLDGGYPAWVAAGNKGVTEAPKTEPTTVEVAPELDASLNVTTDELKSGLETLKIVDSRSKKEFDGATDFGEKRGGHIPGAANIPFPDLFNADGTLKSDEDLQAMFDEAGLTDKNAETVFYCTKGIRSGYMSLVARMLGYQNAKNYDASIYTWAGNPDLPLEK